MFFFSSLPFRGGDAGRETEETEALKHGLWVRFWATLPWTTRASRFPMGAAGRPFLSRGWSLRRAVAGLGGVIVRKDVGLGGQLGPTWPLWAASALSLHLQNGPFPRVTAPRTWAVRGLPSNPSSLDPPRGLPSPWISGLRGGSRREPHLKRAAEPLRPPHDHRTLPESLCCLAPGFPTGATRPTLPLTRACVPFPSPLVFPPLLLLDFSCSPSSYPLTPQSLISLFFQIL